MTSLACGSDEITWHSHTHRESPSSILLRRHSSSSFRLFLTLFSNTNTWFAFRSCAYSKQKQKTMKNTLTGCRVNVCDMALKKFTFTFTYQITDISVFGFETVCYAEETWSRREREIAARLEPHQHKAFVYINSGML